MRKTPYIKGIRCDHKISGSRTVAKFVETESSSGVGNKTLAAESTRSYQSETIETIGSKKVHTALYPCMDPHYYLSTSSPPTTKSARTPATTLSLSYFHHLRPLHLPSHSSHHPLLPQSKPSSTTSSHPSTPPQPAPNPPPSPSSLRLLQAHS